MRRREFLNKACRPVLPGIASWLGGCAAPGGRYDEAQALRAHVDRLRSRDYSEVGVNMLLTGENLPASVHREQDMGGLALSRALNRYARFLTTAKPEASEDDVAALVELIAERDFTAGGDNYWI